LNGATILEPILWIRLDHDLQEKIYKFSSL
jgi:hypothetical protein